MTEDDPSFVYNEVYPKNLKEDGLLEFTDKHFHIGQSYEKEKARQIRCKQCGGEDFNIAMGNWYIAIKCTRCQWELGVHDG
jgi:hypothetical protein